MCSKCSSFKASLAYECGKSVRVCRRCHAALQELSSSTATPSPEIDDGEECPMYNAKEPPDIPFRNRGVLEVKYLFMNICKNSSFHFICKQLNYGYENVENFLAFKIRVNLNTILFKTLYSRIFSTVKIYISIHHNIDRIMCLNTNSIDHFMHS